MKLMHTFQDQYYAWAPGAEEKARHYIMDSATYGFSPSQEKLMHYAGCPSSCLGIFEEEGLYFVLPVGEDGSLTSFVQAVHFLEAAERYDNYTPLKKVYDKQKVDLPHGFTAAYGERGPDHYWTGGQKVFVNGHAIYNALISRDKEIKEIEFDYFSRPQDVGVKFKCTIKKQDPRANAETFRGQLQVFADRQYMLHVNATAHENESWALHPARIAYYRDVQELGWTSLPLLPRLISSLKVLRMQPYETLHNIIRESSSRYSGQELPLDILVT